MFVKAHVRIPPLLARRSWVQLVKFCLVGASGYVVNLIVFAALLRAAGLHYTAAAVGAFLLAATNNYAWNRLWTFRVERGPIAEQGARFFVVACLSLGANLLVLAAFVALGVSAILAQASAIVLVTPLNFLGCKLWTFRARVVAPDSSGRAQDGLGGRWTDGVPLDANPSVGTRAWPRLRDFCAGLTRSLVREGVAVRFAGFCVVGLNGLVINTALFAAGTELLGLPYAAAGFLGAQCATLCNYVLLEVWVFPRRAYARTRSARICSFFVLTNAAIAASAPLLFGLSALGAGYLLANLLSVGLLTLVRFVVADAWIWRAAGAEAERRDEATESFLEALHRALPSTSKEPIGVQCGAGGGHVASPRWHG